MLFSSSRKPFGKFGDAGKPARYEASYALKPTNVTLPYVEDDTCGSLVLSEARGLR